MATPCACTSEKCGHSDGQPCGRPTENEPTICDNCHKRNRPVAWAVDAIQKQFRAAVHHLWPGNS